MKIAQGYYILKSNSSKKLVAYIDGAARGNPGPAGIGVVLKDESGNAVNEISKFLGETTNNIAEYSAFLEALREAGELGYKEVIVYSDSELLANQLNGEYKVKNDNLKILFGKALELINNFKKVEIKHIDRENNKEADKLANKAINLSGFNKIF